MLPHYKKAIGLTTIHWGNEARFIFRHIYGIQINGQPLMLPAAVFGTGVSLISLELRDEE